MEERKIKVEYKVKGVIKNVPSCIVRWTTGPGVSLVESCNRGCGWRENPNLISCWMGSADDGYFSPPNGGDMPLEDIEKYLKLWKKNW